MFSVKEPPATGRRVMVIRQGGKRLVARLDYKRSAFFRSPGKLHWLNDDDKFIDVAFDPVVAWQPFPDDTTPAYVIRAVVDVATPNICLIANGLVCGSPAVCHDTGDPKRPCRCVCEPLTEKQETHD